jgi:hypothetical protein
MHAPDAKTGADGMPASPVFSVRRSSPRQTFNPLKLALLRLVDDPKACPPPWGRGERPFYVDVHDGSPSNLLLRTTREILRGADFKDV